MGAINSTLEGKTMNKLTGYLCIALLGFTGWHLPAGAQANQGPTCDEITSGYICSGQIVPEIIVSAPRSLWQPASPLHIYSILQGLQDSALQQIMDTNVAAIQAALAQYRGLNVESELVEDRQERAAQVADFRARTTELDQKIWEEGLFTCTEIGNAATTLGLTATFVAAVAAAPPLGLAVPPMVLVGASGLALTGDLMVNYVCQD